MEPDEIQGTGNLPAFDRVREAIAKLAESGQHEMLRPAIYDEIVKRITKGRFTKWAYDENDPQDELTSLQAANARHQRVQGLVEKERAGIPSAAATAAGAAFRDATFGMGPKLIGAISPETQATFDEGMQAGAEANPWSEAVGGLGGGVLGAAALGGGVNAAASKLPMWQLTGSLQSTLQGAAAGGLASFAHALGQQPGQVYDPGAAAVPALAGAVLGGVGGFGAEALLSKFNPSYDMAHQAIRVAGGAEGGTASAGVGMAEGVRELEAAARGSMVQLADGSWKQFFPVGLLNKPMLTQLRGLLRKSPAAATTINRIANEGVGNIRTAIAQVADDPVKGYTALLSKVNVNTPEAQALAARLGHPNPQQVSARWLEDMRQEFMGKMHEFKVTKLRTGAQKFSRAERDAFSKNIDDINSILDQVPGFSELRQLTGKLLDQEIKMQRVANMAERSVGRGQPLDKYNEGIERGSRGLAVGLMKAKDAMDLLEKTGWSPFGIMTNPELRLVSGAAAAGAPFTSLLDPVWSGHGQQF